MTHETLLNKKIGIERCIVQTERYYALRGNTPFEDNHLLQDAIAMNLQRMAETAIDVANYLIKKKKLGLPQNSADAFVLLRQANLISDDLTKRMKGMVGFRNVLVHEYRKLDVSIMVDIIERHLNDPLEFADLALRIMAQR